MPAAPAACAHLVLTAAAGRTAGFDRAAAGLPGRDRHRSSLRPLPDTRSHSPRRPAPTGGAYVENV
jgi:hypothetical protein